MRVDLARDAVVGRGGVSAELPRLPLKRELRGRVRLLRRSFINVWLTKTKANAQMKIGLEISAWPLNLRNSSHKSMGEFFTSPPN